MKRVIILYNPIAPYYTMPLQYLALASVINQEKFDIKIIDARIEPSVAAAHEKVKELLPNAICLGISIITGSPIKDAVAVSSMAKRLAPKVPVVWGGWHPSIFPEQSLCEGFADYCVFGQGELTFLELLDALDSNSGFEQVLGLAYFKNNQYYENADRKFVDINSFPSYNYDLISLERYFDLKRIRQIDFYSSQGCPYRCAFCADPYVFSRRWSGLKGSRMLDDVFSLARKYLVDDVHFLDENFFANKDRVIEFSRGIKENSMTFTWVATSRADQIAALDDGMMREIAHAHLRKVIIGAESGSQEMLDFMKKDTLAEDAIASAEKLARHGIGATFNFIVGFPEERFDETLKTLATIKLIKKINPKFEFGVFFFAPYPGTELFEYLIKKGFRVPRTLLEWSEIDFVVYSGYWVKQNERRYVNRFKFYTRLATEQTPARKWMKPLQVLAAVRTKHDFYNLPVEKEIVDFVRYKVLQQDN